MESPVSLFCACIGTMNRKLRKPMRINPSTLRFMESRLAFLPPHEPPPHPAFGHPLPRSERGRGKGEGARSGSGVQCAIPSANSLPARCTSLDAPARGERSEERRVGKGVRCREAAQLEKEH